MGSLELGLVDGVMSERVRPDFSVFMGDAFEEAAREFVARQARKGKLQFTLEKIGAWWDRKNEIDVVGISRAERSILFGECKWSTRPVGINIYVDLREKSKIILQTEEWSDIYYVLFSKKGFTDAMRSMAMDEEVTLVEPIQLVE